MRKWYCGRDSIVMVMMQEGAGRKEGVMGDGTDEDGE